MPFVAFHGRWSELILTEVGVRAVFCCVSGHRRGPFCDLEASISALLSLILLHSASPRGHVPSSLHARKLLHPFPPDIRKINLQRSVSWFPSSISLEIIRSALFALAFCHFLEVRKSISNFNSGLVCFGLLAGHRPSHAVMPDLRRYQTGSFSHPLIASVCRASLTGTRDLTKAETLFFAEDCCHRCFQPLAGPA